MLNSDAHSKNELKQFSDSMTFQNHKIRPTKKPSKIHTFFKKTITKITEKNLHERFGNWGLGIFIGCIILVVMGGTMYVLARNLTLTSGILRIFGSGLATDQYGHTNILVLGVGDKNHDGEDLTDTIMVVSIDEKKNTVSMLSIPRDLYIDTKIEIVGGNRINRVYELSKASYQNSPKALAFTKNTIGSLLGIDLQYYAKVDFTAFKEIVDAIDGIDITLDEPFYDPEYPVEETGLYTTFSLPAGANHLDGETALKYARSRHSTSDFDRAIRQQQIIAALKDKALSLGVLANPAKIKNIFAAVSSNIETDLSLSEILYTATIAPRFTRENMVSSVLNDDPTQKGGFLYTPDREMYNGAFVLVPFDPSWKDIQTFAQLVLIHPEYGTAGATIHVQNGTKNEGLALDLLYFLTRYGFTVERYGNAGVKELTQTTLNPANVSLATAGDSAEKIRETMWGIQTLLPVIIGEEPSITHAATDTDIVLELGEDFIQFYKQNSARFY